MNYKNFLTIYLSYLTSINRSDTTLELYEKELTYFFEFLLKNKIEKIKEITPLHIELYQAHLINDLKNGANTRAKKTSILKNFFQYLTNRDYIDKSPARAVAPIKIKDADVKKRETLTVKEVMKLINVMEKNSIPLLKLRNKCILYIFIFCGLRVSELVDLKVEDFDFKSKTLYVNDGKGGKDREVPLFDEIVKDLKQYLKERPVKSDYFFTRKKEDAPLSQRAVHALIKRHNKKTGNGKNIGCHSLRRACATIQHASGIDIIDIQLNLGHSDISTTTRYIRRDIEKMKDNIRSNNLLAKEMKKGKK